jgi:hypothetical protein
MKSLPPVDFIQGNWERSGIATEGPSHWVFSNGTFQRRWSGGIHFPGPSMQRTGAYEVLSQAETSITLLLHGYEYSKEGHVITFTISLKANTIDDGYGPYIRFDMCPALTEPFNLTDPIDCRRNR